jgi:hypothetical protein
MAMRIAALAALVWGFGLGWHPVAAGGEGERDGLKVAIAAYRQEVAAAKEKLVLAYDAAIKAAAGDPDRELKLRAQRVKFVKRHEEAVAGVEEPPEPAAPEQDGFVMKVITITGREKHAGTSGLRVTVYINGKPEHGRQLRREFKNGAVDTFENLEFDVPLSEVGGVLLRVEGSNAWKLDAIAFQFSQGDRSSKLYRFKVDSWFSGEKTDLENIKGCVPSKAFRIRPVLE